MSPLKILFVPVVVVLLITLFYQTGQIYFLYGLMGIMSLAMGLTVLSNGVNLGRIISLNVPELIRDKHFFTLRRFFWMAGTWVLYSSGFVFLSGIFALWIAEGFIINLNYIDPDETDD